MHELKKSTALRAWILAGGLFLPQLAAVEPPRDNIVVILDASGSMKEAMRSSGRQKMEVAKEALREVLARSVKDTTSVGILVFSAGNLTNDVLYPLGPVDVKRLEEVVMQPSPGHGTPLGAYLKKGADMLLAEREKQDGYGTFRLLVVTDGEASDRQLVDAYLPDILARGITVDVIGVDMRSSHPLATRVHSYRKADDPAALAAAITEVFAEIGASGADVPEEDAFDLLATIPEDLATAMLAALTRRSDEPIRAVARDQRSQAASSRRAPPSSPAPPGGAPAAAPEDSDWGFGRILLLIGVIAMVVGFKRLKRPGRYRG